MLLLELSRFSMRRARCEENRLQWEWTAREVCLLLNEPSWLAVNHDIFAKTALQQKLSSKTAWPTVATAFYFLPKMVMSPKLCISSATKLSIYSMALQQQLDKTELSAVEALLVLCYKQAIPIV